MANKVSQKYCHNPGVSFCDPAKKHDIFFDKYSINKDVINIKMGTEKPCVIYFEIFFV